MKDSWLDVGTNRKALMNKVFYQNMDGMPDDLAHYGCYFMSLMFYRFDELEQQDIINYWETAKQNNLIDNNPSHSSYLDIIDPQGLCDFLKLPFKYIEQHFDADAPVPENTYVIEQWFNPRTNFHHFMKGDGSGNVEYDPIEGGSITHKEGKLDTKRYYTIVS